MSFNKAIILCNFTSDFHFFKLSLYSLPNIPIFFCCSDNAIDNVKNFSDKELRLATDNYDSRNKIGRGGFGTVYQVLGLKTLSYVATLWDSYAC